MICSIDERVSDDWDLPPERPGRESDDARAANEAPKPESVVATDLSGVSSPTVGCMDDDDRRWLFGEVVSTVASNGSCDG